MFQHEAADITTGKGPGIGERKAERDCKNLKGSLCRGKPEDPRSDKEGAEAMFAKGLLSGSGWLRRRSRGRRQGERIRNADSP